MTAFWKRWFGGRVAGNPGPDDALSRVRWLSAEQSPFGVEVLDCRPVAQSMISTTTDQSVATTYLQQRAADGLGLVGRSPESVVRSGCELSYPHAGATRDGPVFKAQEMEDKWDIYLYAGHLYFTRSWTGELFLRTRMIFEPERARMIEVETAGPSFTTDGHAVGTADFIIRSHLYRWIVPHPFPPGVELDERALAMLSFNAFGRRGLFGTFAETTSIPGLEPGD